jgi:hypothetical protein
MSSVTAMPIDTQPTQPMDSQDESAHGSNMIIETVAFNSQDESQIDTQNEVPVYERPLENADALHEKEGENEPFNSSAYLMVSEQLLTFEK